MSVTARAEGSTVLLAVSLKMYFDPARTAHWIAQVAEIARTHPAIVDGAAELVILPSFPSLPAVLNTVAGTPIRVGAQNLHYEDRGPFTGEVSGADLHQLGVHYVEVGHSERRRHFGEDDDMVRRKVRAAWRNQLVPILCVGEPTHVTAADAGRECVRQLDAALPGVAGQASPPPPLAIAYEPEWSIGTEQPADIEHITTVLATIRTHLDATNAPSDATIIYGGSAGEGLLRELGAAADGLFLGRFVHEPMALKAILDESVEAR
ncbi:MAG: triose-phosphate isomerase [Actinomycetota bacterium]|nr:triose-phosphate isomerase [Actinomycetota bacterium]